MNEPGKLIEFNTKKQFKFIRTLGSGGTGDAHLFEDETTDMLFAIKKYAPKETNFIDENYIRFVEEIKILFKISHPNIVRIYNYYLYPEEKTGYLQMEYIDGVPINEFAPTIWDDKNWEDIFLEVIAAFEYLELNNILHRDIRPANIMIDMNQTVKVIDFGFGKSLDNSDMNSNSVLLNWPVSSLPNEVLNNEYNHQTEIYFVGCLFKNLLGNQIESFDFRHIIEKMVNTNPKDRYSSFNEISMRISQGIIGEINFTDEEKQIYVDFADSLERSISTHQDKLTPINNIDHILSNLEELLMHNALEHIIQENSDLINCFIINKFTYYNGVKIRVKQVMNFYNFIRELAPSKQKIVLNNILGRLANIEIKSEFDDDLPF